ncbi:MAG TPA: BTAD domain-containing putative transcriptional regulator, partial [Solirubrobacteraceae bacterium]|nr:BTAD domain-containing putative transcriptional regulator [Solirubrobacteraceae bacterium]
MPAIPDASTPPDRDGPSAAELLDALPYGVLAVSADGVILRANAAARDLVPGVATPAIPTCRDLFSCSGPGGPCERSCFVTRAAGAARPSPEIRIDTAGGISPGALWVTGAPLPAGHGAMLHLRPGWRGDRRRRSEARWQTEPELRIRALGRTQVEALEDSFDGDWLSQRPGQVLKYLVCERTRVVLVDEIAESIWPDAGRTAVNNTRYAIHRLRHKLEPRRAKHGTPAFVVSRGSGYTLDRDRVWLDVDEFERAIDEGRAAMTRLDGAFATQHFERAIGLYGGPFLADEPYAHWAEDERNRLAGKAMSALWVLVALARERGDTDSAIRHLQRLAELDPLD